MQKPKKALHNEAEHLPLICSTVPGSKAMTYWWSDIYKARKIRHFLKSKFLADQMYFSHWLIEKRS